MRSAFRASSARSDEIHEARGVFFLIDGREDGVERDALEALFDGVVERRVDARVEGVVELGHLLRRGGRGFLHEGELDGGEDVVGRDLARCAGELVAALRALDGVHEPRALEQGEDLLEVDLRDAELLRNRDDGDGCACGVVACQICHGCQAVASLGRNLHGSASISYRIYMTYIYDTEAGRACQFLSAKNCMLVFVGKSTGKIIGPYLNGTSIGFSYSCILQYEFCILTWACGARILLRIDFFTASIFT